MAKSAGNLVLVSELLKEHSAAALRLLILDRRWDRDWDFSRLVTRSSPLTVTLTV